MNAPKLIALALSSTLAMAVATPSAALSIGTAYRAPATSAGGLESQGVPGGVASVNPGLSVVTTADGIKSIGSATADAVTGVVKGFVEIDSPALSEAQALSPIANANANVSAAGILAGPGGSPVNVTVSFKFDGAFLSDLGTPALQLIGTLVGGTGSDVSFTSQVSFAHSASTTGVQINTTAERTETIGDIVTVYEDPTATPIVTSAEFGDLAGEARISFSAIAGDTISFTFGLGGTAMAEFGEGGWLASKGGVNFLNSGRATVFVPVGYSLQGPEALLTNVVQVVPEPSSVAMLAAGLGFLLLGRKRRTR